MTIPSPDVASATATAATTSDQNQDDDDEHHSSQQDDIPIDETVPLNCVKCQRPATFMCSSCGLQGPRYCTAECQQSDWKAGHYSTCQSTILRNQRRFASSTQPSTPPTDPFQDPGTTNNDIALTDMNGQQQDQQQQQRTHNDSTDDNAEEFADNLKFYMQQIYLIIKPVVACIVLSIFWVKVGFNDQSDYSPTRPTYDVLSSNNAGSSGSGGGSGGGGDGSSVGLSSFTNAAIIIGQIIVVTVVIVFFFRKGWIKVLIGFFMLVVMFLLGFMTYLLILNLIQIFYIPLDYITLSVALWNFVIVGLVSIFWKGPLWLQQGYLTVLSSLMAFSLTGLEQWTTWILLGLLAVWDLIAVLCPFGPLRLLIESSRTQQREVPALLYSVNAVWFMLASPNHFHLSHTFTTRNDGNENGTTTTSKPLGGPTDIHQYQLHGAAATTTSLQSIDSLGRQRYQASTASSSAPLQQQHHPLHTHTSENTTETPMATMDLFSTNRPSSHEADGFYQIPDSSSRSATMIATTATVGVNDGATTAPADDAETDVRRRNMTQGEQQQQQQQRHSQENPIGTQPSEVTDEEDAERSGLKLGLGDFVFYSVLVARAAMYDWITTVCCTIAVLTGLTATIFLLAIYKKALPALPISIAFGILFYFTAKAVLVPYIASICVYGMVGI